MPGAVLGSFEISLVRESTYWWDGGAFFGVVPKTLWSRRAAADELNRIPAGFNCYLIRTGEHTILIETGCGDKIDARARERMKLPPDPEPLPEVIARHGFDPEAIDMVINSHLHWDHCGGNTIVSGGVARAAFPRARYYASRGEWEHAHERLVRDGVSYIDANYDPLVESGQMILVDGDYEVAPGIRMRRAPGHNRDMMVITAESGGETFCFLADLVPTAAHLQPSWIAAFDLYPLQAIETKLEWLTAAAESNWLCAFAHDPAIDFARIVKHPKTGFALAE
jgi:glyoxylase-like metal-dependent hydrolase (beta-lactamase superfamily II)